MTGNPLDQPVLYLTTTGRSSGLPREIEIWFVTANGRLYLLAEHFRGANWVLNIESEPRVLIRLGEQQRRASARILDQARDGAAWHLAQDLGRQKYGWGDGLPVEITPDEPF
jgi:deazaflavin-dependent oxidoreductase (nitroreductase family)